MSMSQPIRSDGDDRAEPITPITPYTPYTANNSVFASAMASEPASPVATAKPTFAKPRPVLRRDDNVIDGSGAKKAGQASATDSNAGKAVPKSKTYPSEPRAYRRTMSDRAKPRRQDKSSPFHISVSDNDGPVAPAARRRSSHQLTHADGISGSTSGLPRPRPLRRGASVDMSSLIKTRRSSVLLESIIAEAELRDRRRRTSQAGSRRLSRQSSLAQTTSVKRPIPQLDVHIDEAEHKRSAVEQLFSKDKLRYLEQVFSMAISESGRDPNRADQRQLSTRALLRLLQDSETQKRAAYNVNSVDEEYVGNILTRLGLKNGNLTFHDFALGFGYLFVDETEVPNSSEFNAPLAARAEAAEDEMSNLKQRLAFLQEKFNMTHLALIAEQKDKVERAQIYEQMLEQQDEEHLAQLRDKDQQLQDLQLLYDDLNQDYQRLFDELREYYELQQSQENLDSPTPEDEEDQTVIEEEQPETFNVSKDEMQMLLDQINDLTGTNEGLRDRIRQKNIEIEQLQLALQDVKDELEEYIRQNAVRRESANDFVCIKCQGLNEPVHTPTTISVGVMTAKRSLKDAYVSSETDTHTEGVGGDAVASVANASTMTEPDQKKQEPEKTVPAQAEVDNEESRKLIARLRALLHRATARDDELEERNNALKRTIRSLKNKIVELEAQMKDAMQNVQISHHQTRVKTKPVLISVNKGMSAEELLARLQSLRESLHRKTGSMHDTTEDATGYLAASARNVNRAVNSLSTTIHSFSKSSSMASTAPSENKPRFRNVPRPVSPVHVRVDPDRQQKAVLAEFNPSAERRTVAISSLKESTSRVRQFRVLVNGLAGKKDTAWKSLALQVHEKNLVISSVGHNLLTIPLSSIARVTDVDESTLHIAFGEQQAGLLVRSAAHFHLREALRNRLSQTV